jgi:acetylornithine deacetylase
VSSDERGLETLLADLVRIDSRVPWLIEGAPGEAAMAGFVAAWLRRAGVTVELEEVAPGRPNVIARIPGTGGGRALGFNAHLDTVGDAGWPDRARAPVIDGERLVGLGAADDKGHVAVVMLVLASLAVRASGTGARSRGDVLAAFVVDEEATSIGSFDLVRRHAMDACLVVEPFGLGRAIVSHQGFGWLDIVVHGRAAHGSAPEEGIDAISGAAAIVERLDRLGSAWRDRPDPHNGATVYHASTISGGTDYATYPATVTVGIEIGTQPGETIADRVRDIEAILGDVRATRPELRAEVIVKLDRDPFRAAGHEPLWDSLDGAHRAVTGAPLEAVGLNAWMDCAITQAAGIPTLSVGAGGGNLHAPDEWVSLPELRSLVRILERTAIDFCA